MTFFDILLNSVLTYTLHFSYLAIFVMIVLGSVGIPIPEELILLVAGYLSSRGFMNLFIVILVATVATIAADNISYWIGRKKGVSFLRSSFAARIFFSPRRLARIEHHFKKHGGKTVLLARFLLGFRMISFIIAGSSQMPWKTFIKYNIIGACIWVPAVILIGYIVSSGIFVIWEYFENLKHIIAALLIIGLLGYFFLRRFKKKEEEREKEVDNE